MEQKRNYHEPCACQKPAPVPCDKPKCDNCRGSKGNCFCLPPKVIPVEVDGCPILFRKVIIPASVGDETTYPPVNGLYRNVLLEYETTGNTYLYSSDGIPTHIVNDLEQITKLIRELVEAEAQTRAEADDHLQDNIDSAVTTLSRAIGEETSAREGADRILDGKIEAETTARGLADQTLDGKITDEKNNREDADRLIWAEINTIEIASDVVDIVGTYAALQAYDTSKLQDNDIIKVLKDETHSNATTYYRWGKTASQFTYIGEEGPYYTTSQTDTLLAGKQDTLTAGSNITISNNVISATDTTYSDFTGTDGTAAGTAGLVPAPATTDAGKYLKADGTWDTISIPTVTLYSGTGQNTDGAMTQKAVTDTLFESNDTTRVKIGSGVVNGGAASVVIGSQGAQTLTPNSIAIGNGGTTAGSSGGNGYNVAIGSYGVNATGGQSVAIGGYGAMATAEGAITIGTGGAQASAAHSVAIGHGGTTAAHSDSVALGSASTTGRTYELSLGQNASGQNPEKTRYIAHVTAGVNNTDAVNVAQLNAAIPGVMTGATSSAAGASGLVPAPAAGDGAKYLAGDGTWKTISAPTVTLYSDIGQNTDGAMTQKAVSDSLFVNSDRTRIKISDNTSSNNASGDIVIGHSGVAAYTANSIAIGMNGTTAGTSGSTYGSNTAIGMNSVRATGGDSTALGSSGVTASGKGSTAIGALGVTASADRSVAIGYGNTFATHSDSVALGSNSTTGRTNELSIGTPADSANPEKTRYIAHVTAGVNDTDAVNKKQLDDAIAGVPSASNINSTDWSGLWQ